MVPVAFLSQMCALEFCHHPTRLYCNRSGRGPLSTPPSPSPSGILGIKGTIEGKLLPYYSFNYHPSRIPHICKSHSSPFFDFCPFVGLILEDQIGVCKRTRQSRSVFRHSPGHEFRLMPIIRKISYRYHCGGQVSDATAAFKYEYSVRGKGE